MTLLSGACWNVLDDDGTGQSGTIINSSWLDLIEASINALIHSTNNPTVTPADIIDEIVVARNGQATLNDYLATLGTTDVLEGLADLGVDFLFIGGRSLLFSDPDVAHGMTALKATDVWGAIQEISGVAGGMFVQGYSDTDAVGLHLWGISGSVAPTVPPLVLRGSKKNGTSSDAVGNAEPLLQITNDGDVKAKMYGDGGLNLLTGGLKVGFTGVPSVGSMLLGDSNFGLFYLSAAVTRVIFDSGDYLEYDRAVNSYSFVVGGVVLSAIYSDGRVRFASALIAPGGGAAAVPGTIGGTGPATAAQNTWLKCEDNGGNAFYLPVWK